jgi:hypothetical protein
METLSRTEFELGLMGGCVMPRLVSGTGLHGREDVDQAGRLASLGDARLDPRFTARRRCDWR